MTNIRGLDPMPRNWDANIPRSHIPYLEDIRRASNAVRVLRRRGLPHAAARLRARQATENYARFLEREEHAFNNPGLF